jgi:hypothetical protein
MLDRNRLRIFLLAFALLWTAVVASPVVHAATFVVINNDGAGEGFNDPTAAAPVGGNTGTTIGQQRLIAFQAAADIWGARLFSSVPIRVGAQFNPLSCTAFSGTLGFAGPTNIFSDFSGAPVANTWYAVALANARHGSDLDAGDDISAQFNSNIGTPGCLETSGWYYGLDSSPPGNLIDFVSVLIHELGHGLGFLTFVDLTTGAKAGGFNDAFMLNLENHGASPSDYPSMSNAQRVAASTSTGNLHWTGANVRAASGVLSAGKVGDHVRMFAPNPQQSGSSVSHWDTALTPNQVMEPNYTQALHSPNLELPLFQDIGWMLSASPSSLTVTPTTNISSTGQQGGSFSPVSFDYSLSATSGSVNYSISGVPSWLTASATSGTVTTTPTTVTFAVNASANSLCGGTYNATITFTDTTNSTTVQTTTATLIVTATNTLIVSPASNMASVGNPGGPFSPASFPYQLSATSCTVNYSISGLPSWLNVSSSSGTVTTTPTTITFTVNSNANSLPVGGYNATISFANTTNGLGNQTRNAALTVNSGGSAPPARQTWVSGTGSDSNDCTLVAPCQTFAGALPKTAAGGEINCLDAGGFGVVTIDKSISIMCAPHTAGVLVAAGNGITVNAGASDKIILQGLDIEGLGTGLNGVHIVGSSSVVIRRSSIHNFTGNGVNLVGTAGAKVLLQDSVISHNGGGINVQGAGGVANTAVIDRTTIETHTSFAVRSAQGGAAFLSTSNLIGSGPKLVMSGGGTVTSYGNNLIRGAGVAPTTTLPRR